MTDFSASSSYVDDYLPPQTAAPQKTAQPVPTPVATPVSQPSVLLTPKPVSTAPTPAPMPKTEVAKTPAAPSEALSQSLEDQNIFYLLGVEDATEAEKESFLDELQQVIWEDFLENDVDLLLTEEEMVDFKKIADRQDLKEADRQAEMVNFLDKLVPDLEKIMLEKALELKEEMMRERMTQMTELYKDAPDKLAQVKRASQLLDDQQWHSAAEVLNTLLY